MNIEYRKSDIVVVVSLLKEHNHVVVDIQTYVAVGFVLNGEAAPQQAQAVPCLAVAIIKFCFYVLSDITVIARAETFQRLDSGNHCHL